MRTILRLTTVLFMLVLASTPALAQSGRFYYRDDGNRLNKAAIQSAAQPLLDKGAYVAVYAVDSGKGTEFLSLLQDDGLRNGDTVNPNLIAIFVSFQDRYSEIRYGDKWVSALGAANTAASIQQNTLNTSLASGDIPDAFTKTLSALNRAIDQRVPASSTTPAATPESSSGGIAWPAWLVGLLALIGIPVGWQAVSKRRAASQALDSARKAREDARLKAGAAIADTAQLMKDSQEKAQYDKLSYPAAEVANLTTLQQAAEQQFMQAQIDFKSAEDAIISVKTPTEEQYKAGAVSYAQIAEEVGKARDLAMQAEARRAELDKLAQAAPGEIDSAKKILADAAERLGVLGSETQPELITRPVAALIGRAEALLAEHRAADAIQAARVASAGAQELNHTLERFAAIREGISTGRAAAEKAAAQGFRIDAGLNAFNTSEGVLAQAARTLEHDGVQAATPLLDQAEAARAEGVAQGGGLPALFEANARRIPILRQEHAAVAAYIAEGRRAFDAVDEYAEGTWSDIRGNGSEAEAAHTEAGKRIDAADAGNTMEAQQFIAAQQHLSIAAERLASARTLIDTIIQRLKDLEAARAAARDEVATAQKDIEQGWAFIRANDADVAKAPEQTLAEAVKQIKQAETELAQQRPNWLVVVKAAQEANRLADEALAAARSELEVVTKLRDQLQRSQQVAIGEVQKATQFAGLHRDDLPAESITRLNTLQKDLQASANTAQQAGQREEEARVAALRDAVTIYGTLQERAGQVYQQLYVAFQQAEELRRQVAEAIRQAQRAIEGASDAARNARGLGRSVNQADQLLEQARRDLNSIGTVHTERDKTSAVRQAESARSSASQAESIYRSAIAERQRQERDRLGDVVQGAIIGSILSGGGHGGGHGGGGSWGGGGSSGGGGGSSGGGSWGGGGSSGGGSWGGGGSSGGSGW